MSENEGLHIEGEGGALAHEAANAAEEAQARQDIEAEARKYGWKPREEFTLDPDRWTPAERFMELPATQAKIARDDAKAAREEAKRLAAELDKTKRSALDAVKAVQEQAEASYRAKLEEIEREKVAAVETADSDAYKAAVAREKALKPPPQVNAEEPRGDLTASLHDKKPWLTDPVLRGQAAQIIDRALAAGESVPPPSDIVAHVEFAEKRLARYYPHLFKAEPAAQQRSRVESGGLAGGGSRDAASGLSAEQREAARIFVERGVFKSVDEYARKAKEMGL